MNDDTRVMCNSYMAWVKTRPCFISGTYGVDAAHLRLFARPHLLGMPRANRLLDRTPRGHKPPYGFYCIPLKPELHRAEYKHSLHWWGDERKFFEHQGVSLDEVFSYGWQSSVEFFTDVWPTVEAL